MGLVKLVEECDFSGRRDFEYRTAGRTTIPAGGLNGLATLGCGPIEVAIGPQSQGIIGVATGNTIKGIDRGVFAGRRDLVHNTVVRSVGRVRRRSIKISVSALHGRRFGVCPFFAWVFAGAKLVQFGQISARTAFEYRS